MDLIQKCYATILDPFSRINTKKNKKARSFLIGILFFAIFMVSFVAQLNSFLFEDPAYEWLLFLKDFRYGGYRLHAVVAATFLLLIVFLTVEKQIGRVKWNFYFVTSWFLLNLLIIIAGVSHDIGEGYLITQIVIMVVVPALSLTLDGKEKLAGFFDIFAWTAIIFLIGLTVIHMIFFPFGMLSEQTSTLLNGYEQRYLGLIHHPNRLAEFTTIGFLSSLYIVYRKKGLSLVIAAITAGFCVMQDMMSMCRVSLLAAIAVIIALVVICIREKKGAKLLLVTLVIAVISSVATYEIITRGEDPLRLRSDISRQMTVVAATEKDGKDKEDSPLWERIFREGDMNSVSSGRIGLWKMCLSKLTWNGNDVTYVYPMRVLNSEETGYTYFSLMHNVVLEFSMRCGWVTGLILLGIELWALVFCLAVVFGRKKRITDARVFAVFGISSFLLFGNVEPINEAFFRLLLLVFYLALIPVFNFGANFKFKKLRNK